MAECNPWDKASQQHMAPMAQWECHRRHHLIAHHQVWVWEATQWECQNPQLESQQDSQKQTQTLYSTEGNQ